MESAFKRTPSASSSTHMKRITSITSLLLIVLVAPAFNVCLAQIQISGAPDLSIFTLEPNSKIWFEGTTTISTFDCVSNTIDGVAYLSSETQNARKRVLVAVPIVSLNCGKEEMNSDMYRALKERLFHSINYEMLDAEPVVSRDTAPGWFTARTRGRLTIAGKTAIIEMIVHVKEMRSGMYRVEGSKALSMKEFSIDPPSKFFGLIRVKDTLVVHFDLTASIHPAFVLDRTKSTTGTEPHNDFQNGK